MINTLRRSKFIQFALICSVLVSLCGIYIFEHYKLQQKHLFINKATSQYISLLSNSILHASSAAYPIAALIQSQQGDTTGFNELSTKMLPHYPGVTALELQPNGIVNQISPLSGNETAISYDVRSDPDINDNSFNPLLPAKLTLSGPYTLAQGGKGFIARLPIILDTDKGKEFWGFSAILIRTSDILNTVKFADLSDLGLAFKLSAHPHNSDKIHDIAQSKQTVTKNPDIFNLNVPGGNWVLQVSPANGWEGSNSHTYQLLLAAAFIITITSLAILTTRREEQQQTQTELKLDETQSRLQEAQNYADIGYWELSIKDNSIIWSKQMYTLFGLPSDAPASLKIMRKIVSVDVFCAIRDSINPNINNKTQHHIKYPITRSIDHEQRWIESSGKIIRNKNGRAEKITGFIRDITELKNSELRRKINNQVLRQLVNGVTLNVILNSIVQLIEKDNTLNFCSILLLDKSGKHLLSTAAPSLPGFYIDAINGVEIGDGVGSCGTAAFTHKRVIVEDIQTHPYWANFKQLATDAKLGSCWSQPIIGTNAAIFGTFAIYHHKKHTPTKNELQLIEYAAQIASIAIERSRSNEQLTLSSKVFSHTQEGICITDSNGIIVDINPAYSEITGYSREEIIGQNPSFVSSGRQSSEFYSNMWTQLLEQGYWKGEVWNRKKNGELFAELLSISSLHDTSDETINYVGIFSDITQSKNHQEELNHMAHYDLLTGLPNRALFADRFQQAIAHSKRCQTQLAVCFIDLDNFKPINDNFGHSAGDQLLIEVAKRITACIREEDTISRQGGDEFTLLLNDIDTAEESLQTLKRIHQSLAQPYAIGNKLHYITASSGATLYPQDDADIDTLLRHADQAMYQAKLSGKNRYHLFNPSEDKETKYKHHKISEIEQALVNNEFVLYYQPKVHMLSGEVFGAEALIRWLHPQKGLRPPLDFLPLIDGTDLDVKLGNWVIKQAIDQINTWDQQGIQLEVSVNISSYHLQSADFHKQLELALQAQPTVDPRLLQLEILESSALGDLNTITSVIKMCQESFGTGFALDDFGTGYSSLTHLRNLPVDTIKIDQTFIRDMIDDPDDFSIIESTISLAKSFNRSVIAEGVETTEHGLMLLIMGCELAQGYGIAKPMPSNELKPWLDHYDANKLWLSYKLLKLSEQKKKASLYSLIANHWNSRFIQCIISDNPSNKSWPIMDSDRCHCSAWIERAQQDNSFDLQWISQLEQLHTIYHLQAQSLQSQYRHGEISLAKEGLNELKSIFDDMTNLLNIIINE